MKEMKREVYMIILESWLSVCVWGGGIFEHTTLKANTPLQ